MDDEEWMGSLIMKVFRGIDGISPAIFEAYIRKTALDGKCTAILLP
jgi:hypothetical protein